MHLNKEAIMTNLIKHSIIIILLLQALFAEAQSKKYASYSRSQENSYLDSANYYINTNPALAYDFVEKALAQAIKNKNWYTEAECYTTIGKINYQVQQFDLAIDNYNKALNILSNSRNKKQEQKIKKLLAKAHEANNNLDKSEAFYQESAAEAQSNSDTEELKKSKTSLANIYKKQGRKEEAIKELEEVRKMDIEDGDKQQQFYTNQELIDVYKENEPSRALELSEENEEIANTNKDTLALINTLQSKADVYENIGNKEEQLNVLQQSLEVREKQDDYAGQSEDKLRISKVLVEQEKLNDAIAYLEESIELSERAGKIETKKKALKSLSSVYDRSGNYNRALSIYKEYVNAAEESARQREEKILENLELMQNLTKRLQRIDMLENQKSLNDKTIELLEREKRITEKSIKQQQSIIIALIIGMVILLAAIYLVFKSARQKRVANQLLALRSLRSQMNPHFIFNALNSVNSFISKSDDRSANKYLTDFSKLMRAVMENSKSDFVSLASEIQILELYLKLEHHRFKEKFDYTFEVAEDIDKENIQIPPMLVQPYIENAVWHGLRYKEDKGYLKVKISNGGNLSVLIEDNGIGRKKSLELKTKNQQDSVSTGMKNINTRLQIINQIHKTNLRVNIEDLDKEQQTGTKVTIDIIQQL